METFNRSEYGIERFIRNTLQGNDTFTLQINYVSGLSCSMKSQKNTPYILWADDDDDDLLMIREIIRSINESFTVLVVRNGREVIEHLQMKDPGNFPCLIILDVNMPVLDGKMTLAQLKKDHVYREIPVIMFTTSNSRLDKTFFQMHGVEMITKPPSYDRLREVVRQFLDICS